MKQASSTGLTGRAASSFATGSRGGFLRRAGTAGNKGTPGPQVPPWGPRRVEGVGLPLFFLAMLCVLRLQVAHIPGLAFDEAYYWSWSKALDLGYFDHPPAVAWMVAASTVVLGDTELGVRAMGVILGALMAVLMVFHTRRPWLIAMAAMAVPLFALGGLLATPDVPLLMGWTLGIIGTLRGGRWWLLTGLGAGLAMSSKLTGVLLLPLLFLGRPADLRTRWPWLGAALALLLVLPNLFWQANNSWATWRFQLQHGLGLQTGTQMAGQVLGHRGPLGVAEFIAGQVALVTPIMFLAFAGFWLAAWKVNGDLRVLWWSSFPVLVFFSVASWFSKAEANWAAPAYLGAILGLGHLGYRWRKIAWVGAGLAATTSILLILHVIHPMWNFQKDPTLELTGGRALGEAVEAWGEDQVYTSRYQEAAWIRFYGGIQALVWPGNTRSSQLDLVGEPARSDHALFVRPWRRSAPHRIDASWKARSGPNTVVARDSLSRLAGRWQVYEVWDYMGACGDRGAAEPVGRMPLGFATRGAPIKLNPASLPDQPAREIRDMGGYWN